MLNFILGSFFASGLVAAVFLFRSKQATQEVGHRSLRHSIPLKTFSLAGSSLFLTGIMFNFQNAALNEAIQCLGVMLPILILVFAGAIETLFFALRYDQKSIIQRSPWSGEKVILIGALVGLRTSRWMDQNLLISNTGERVRVPKHLNGSEELLRTAEIVVQANQINS